MKMDFSARPQFITENWCAWQDFMTAMPSLVFVVTGWKSNGKENADHGRDIGNKRIYSVEYEVNMNAPYNATSFNGFPKGFADFLFSLQFNNTIDMLPENKPVYRRFITDPLTLLFHALIQPALSVSESLTTKPSKCVSTMYSDMRFSRTTPLKGYMYIRFREPSGDKDILGLYFDMGCDYYSYGIRIYKQTSEGMDRIRENILKNSGEFARELENLNKIGMAIIGDKFAKDHYPEINNEAIRDFLNRKNFYIGKNCPINESVYNGELRDEIAEAFARLKAIYILIKKSLLCFHPVPHLY